MKVIAAVVADFDRGPLGRRSRLADDLRGEPVLRRTLRRVLAAPGLASVHLLVRVEQAPAARSLVDDLPVQVETHQADPVPWWDSLRVGRAWALDAWRGGLGGAYAIDETLHPWLLEALGRREQADGVVDVPAAAVLLDPVLLGAMIKHFSAVCGEYRMTFTQTAPGLSAAVYATSLLTELAGASQPIGWSLGYRVGVSGRDSMMLDCFYPTPLEVRRVAGRCLADTDGGFERVGAILSDCGGESASAVTPDAAAVSRWLADHEYAVHVQHPAEVEIELTTEDPLPAHQVRPRGPAVGRRGPMDLDLCLRLVGELARRDDVRVVLGGFGDPLLHPAWERIARICREAGILTVALRTSAVTLDDSTAERLLNASVDVLNVLLDAHSAEVYQALAGWDGYAIVRNNLERFLEKRSRLKATLPWVVCEMAKTAATIDQIEAFHDEWTARTGAAVIAGPSTYGGQWPDLSVMDMSPPTRGPCRRIFSRAMVLADGRVLVCDQDFAGRWPLGSLQDSSFSDLWAALVGLRQDHRAGRYDTHPPCLACREWHRP